MRAADRSRTSVASSASGFTSTTRPDSAALACSSAGAFGSNGFVGAHDAATITASELQNRARVRAAPAPDTWGSLMSISVEGPSR